MASIADIALEVTNNGTSLVAKLSYTVRFSRADRKFDPFYVEIAQLTRREREVMGLLSEGLTNAQIAARLFIAPSTAKVHVRHILEKLGARNRLQAVLRAQGGLETEEG